MPARKSFALRIDAKTYVAMQRWGVRIPVRLCSLPPKV